MVSNFTAVASIFCSSGIKFYTCGVKPWTAAASTIVAVASTFIAMVATFTSSSLDFDSNGVNLYNTVNVFLEQQRQPLQWLTAEASTSTVVDISRSKVTCLPAATTMQSLQPST